MNTLTKRLIVIIGAIIIVILGFTLYQNFSKDKKTNPQKEFTNSIDEGVYVKDVLVVGFNKEVSQAKAEEILDNLGVKFFRTKDVNMGMKFFEETGETFLVRVPDNQGQVGLGKITKIPEVKNAGFYVDPEKVLVD
jgi:hypothetical protein